ncbi:chemotaxis regulatory protein ChePep [Helicobacter pylori]
MKMILFNQNPMITKLLESVSNKLELSMEDFNRYQELSTRLKEDPEWILIADDECLEKLDQVDWLELKEIISQNKNSVCMYKKGNEAQPFLEGFEMKIKKPFLPTEVLKVLQKKLGSNMSELEPSQNLDPTQEVLETNWDELENLGDLEALVQEEPNNEEQLLPTLNDQEEKEEVKEEEKEEVKEEEKEEVKEEEKEEIKETPQEEKPKDDEIQEGETQKNEEVSKELETQEELEIPKEETQEQAKEQEPIKEETQENKEEKQEKTQDSPSTQELEAMQELVKEIQENSNGQENKKETQENTETPQELEKQELETQEKTQESAETPQDVETPQETPQEKETQENTETPQEKETQKLETPQEEIQENTETPQETEKQELETQEKTQESAETPQDVETPQEKETQKLETPQEEIQENTEKMQKLETQEDHYESIEDIPEPVMAQAMGEELPFLNESIAKIPNNENDTETPKESVIKTPQEKEESDKTSSPLELHLNLQDLLKSLNQESLKSLLENKTLSIKITLEDKKPDA